MADTDPASYPALKLLIDGEWLEAGSRRTHRVVEPATGAMLGELPLADAADLDRALDSSTRAYRQWRATDGVQRGAVLRKAAELLRQRVEPIAQALTREEGKPLAEARGEVAYAAALFDYAGEEARRITGRVLPRAPGMRSLVTYEPVGVVAAFAPWNFPIVNPARKLAGPIAAGCSVILKPAEETPASAIAIVQALLDAGLPSNVVQLVFGVPDELSRHILASPIVRKLSFTGSTAVGKHLMKLCADTMKRTTMELGGHGPVILFDDCDLDKAVETLAAGKLRNAGQVCVSPTRFYVQEGIHDRFVAAFAERYGRVQVGNGLDAASSMGPLANPRRPDAIEQFVADALAKGATLRTGGERMEGNGFFWRPTVLSDVPVSARLMNEEPFGPVVVTAPFRTLDEVVAEANRLPFGLAGYAFTENARTANLISDALEVGMVGINTVGMSHADAPFGGVKESGHGSEDGREGVYACLVTKAVHQV